MSHFGKLTAFGATFENHEITHKTWTYIYIYIYICVVRHIQRATSHPHYLPAGTVNFLCCFAHLQIYFMFRTAE
jgi:hypothetical protein